VAAPLSPETVLPADQDRGNDEFGTALHQPPGMVYIREETKPDRFSLRK
jgi:hypothetical protein